MEYMHPLFAKHTKPITGTGKVVWIVYGTHLTFIMSTDRNSKDIVAMCTASILKVLWFLAFFRPTVARIEYLLPHVECPAPKYG